MTNQLQNGALTITKNITFKYNKLEGTLRKKRAHEQSDLKKYVTLSLFVIRKNKDGHSSFSVINKAKKPSNQSHK